MTAPWIAQTVAQRWVQSVLTGAPAVTALIPSAAIYPNVAPAEVVTRHLVHGFAGPNGGRIAAPMRAPIASVSLLWDITGWEPAHSQQALEPAMEAVMGVLIGDDTRGKTHVFVDGSRRWGVDCDAVGPEYVPLDQTPAGVWAPVRDRYAITLRPS